MFVKYSELSMVGKNNRLAKATTSRLAIYLRRSNSWDYAGLQETISDCIHRRIREYASVDKDD